MTIYEQTDIFTKRTKGSYISPIWGSIRTFGSHINKLGASVADDTTDIELTDKRQVKIHPFSKLKELQADTQANAFAAHLILPNRTNAPWTNS